MISYYNKPNRLKNLMRVLPAVAFVVGLLSTGHAAAPEPVPEGGFAIVVLPDTQSYTWKRPELYALQTAWAAANVEKHRFATLLHVGDITQINSRSEWESARIAQDILKGHLSAVYVPGNHDIVENNIIASRRSFFSEYITLADYRAQPGFGGVYDKEPLRTENSWHIFDAGGRKWLVLALEFAPRDDVLRWANEVVAANSDRTVIMVTHAYLRPDNTRFDRRELVTATDKTPAGNKGIDGYPLSQAPDNGGYNDAGDMWDKLVSLHANFAIVLSGHVCTSAHLESKGIHGNTVHQILVNYQNRLNEKNCWLRLLQFMPGGRTVRVRDYTPLLNQTSADPSCAFEFTLDPSPPPAR